MRTLCIELTTRCPLRCVHCSACASPEGRLELEPDRLASYLAKRAPLAEVYLSGGEPFTRSDLPSIITVARAVASDVIVYSSGTSFGVAGVEPLAEGALRDARAAGLDRIDVSFYAEDSSAHDAVTGVAGSFAAAIETCRRMEVQRIPLGVHFVPAAHGGDHLQGVARLARELEAKRLHVLALAAQGRAIGRSTLPSSSLLASLSNLLASAPPFEIIVSSALRSSLGLPRTNRDDSEVGFVDARGFEYPGEGSRDRISRSLSMIGTSVDPIRNEC